MRRFNVQNVTRLAGDMRVMLDLTSHGHHASLAKAGSRVVARLRAGGSSLLLMRD